MIENLCYVETYNTAKRAVNHRETQVYNNLDKPHGIKSLENSI